MGAMLTVDEACEYIEHAIVKKRAEVIDAPSRFLSLMHTFVPSFIVGLNSLVYRLEGEKAPEDVAAQKLKRSATRKLKMTSSSKNQLLKFLASFMWFFSRLELVVFVRIGLPWVARDLVVLVVMALVMVVWSLCLVARSVVGRGRQVWARVLSAEAQMTLRIEKVSADVAILAETSCTEPSCTDGDVSADVRAAEMSFTDDVIVEEMPAAETSCTDGGVFVEMRAEACDGASDTTASGQEDSGESDVCRLRHPRVCTAPCR